MLPLQVDKKRKESIGFRQASINGINIKGNFTTKNIRGRLNQRWQFKYEHYLNRIGEVKDFMVSLDIGGKKHIIYLDKDFLLKKAAETNKRKMIEVQAVTGGFVKKNLVFTEAFPQFMISGGSLNAHFLNGKIDQRNVLALNALFEQQDIKKFNSVKKNTLSGFLDYDRYIIYKTVITETNKYYIGYHKQKSEGFDNYYGSGKVISQIRETCRILERNISEFMERIDLCVCHGIVEARKKEKEFVSKEVLQDGNCLNLVVGG